jgi:prolipoprotein diacylglyceryltransferase
MKPLVLDWLVRHGLPAWLAPDYAMMVGLAAILGAVLAMRVARRDGEDLAVQARALLLAYAAALVGGFAFEWVRALPVAIAIGSPAPVLFAGRAAYGGLLAALVAPAVYLRKRPGAIAAFFDRAVLPMGIAFAFVRVGCFLEGCDYGQTTALAVGVRFPPGSLAANAHAAAGWVPEGAFSLPVHPTELYESALGLLALGLALPVLLRRRERDGRAFAVWMSVYAVGRFALEWLRADADRGIYGGLSSAQWVSLGILAALGVAAVRRRSLPPSRVAAATVAVAGLLLAVRAADAKPNPAPPPPPAAAPAPAASDALTLKDGSRVTGKITEVTPGDHATLLFADGHTSTYPWAAIVKVEMAGVVMTYDAAPTAPVAPSGPPPPALPAGTPPPPPAVGPSADTVAAPADSPQRDRILTFRVALVSQIVLARPDVPSAFATEVDAFYRFRLDDHTRLELGLEGRELQNVEATEWSFGVPADLVFEVSRHVEMLVEGAIFNTWFQWTGSSGNYFANTNAYGMRLAGGAQLALGPRVLLGVSPVAFSTVSSETVGVITAWEPRAWFGLDF